MTASCGGKDISVLLNNGDGSFEASGKYLISNCAYNVIGADFDGDGDQDLTVRASGPVLSIWFNNGDGTFAPQANYEGPAQRAVDLDGDGDHDLAGSQWQRDVVSVLLNNGDGSFAQKVDYPAGSQPSGLAAEDLDGDGDQDLATPNFRSSTVSVLLNNGDGSFAPNVDYATAAGPQTIVAANFDADSDPDLAVGGPRRGVSVLLNFLDAPAASTDIEYEEQLLNVPEAYTLSQNYPNPFNPQTVIHYEIPVRSHVRLSVFNTSGQKVATLVKNSQPPGHHSLVWNGTDDTGRNLASGVYLYRLSVGETQTDTRKLLLLR